MRYLLLVLWCVMLVQADDGMVEEAGRGGGMRFLAGEHRTIRMMRQRVAIDLYPSYYTVHARFVFHNAGPATRVTMGFPERGNGDGDGAADNTAYRLQSGFLSFTSDVDGIRVSVRRVVAAASREQYRAFWVKTVAFARNQTRIIDVYYRAKPAKQDTTETPIRRYVTYDFTARTWHDTVGRIDLVYTTHLPGVTLCDVTYPFRTQCVPAEADSNHVRWTNMALDGAVELTYVSTIPDWLDLHGDGMPIAVNDGRPVTPDYTLHGTPTDTTFDWLPPALVRGGVGFIAVRALQRSLDASRPTALSLVGKTATLQAGCTHLTFTSGMATMHVDGTVVRLPAAPVLLQSTDGFASLYVPLRAVAHILHGQVVVEAEKHVAWVRWPREAAGRAK